MSCSRKNCSVAVLPGTKSCEEHYRATMTKLNGGKYENKADLELYIDQCIANRKGVVASAVIPVKKVSKKKDVPSLKAKKVIKSESAAAAAALPESEGNPGSWDETARYVCEHNGEDLTSWIGNKIIISTTKDKVLKQKILKKTAQLELKKQRIREMTLEQAQDLKEHCLLILQALKEVKDL